MQLSLHCYIKREEKTQRNTLNHSCLKIWVRSWTKINPLLHCHVYSLCTLPAHVFVLFFSPRQLSTLFFLFIVFTKIWASLSTQRAMALAQQPPKAGQLIEHRRFDETPCQCIRLQLLFAPKRLARARRRSLHYRYLWGHQFSPSLLAHTKQQLRWHSTITASYIARCFIARRAAKMFENLQHTHTPRTTRKMVSLLRKFFY